MEHLIDYTAFNDAKQYPKDMLFDYLNGDEPKEQPKKLLTKAELEMKMKRYKAERRQGTVEDMTTFRDAVLPKPGYNCFGEPIINKESEMKKFKNDLFNKIKKPN